MEITPVREADSRVVQTEEKVVDVECEGVEEEEEEEKTQEMRTECKVPNRSLTFSKGLSSVPRGTRD